MAPHADEHSFATRPASSGGQAPPASVAVAAVPSQRPARSARRRRVATRLQRSGPQSTSLPPGPGRSFPDSRRESHSPAACSSSPAPSSAASPRLVRRSRARRGASIWSGSATAPGGASATHTHAAITTPRSARTWLCEVGGGISLSRPQSLAPSRAAAAAAASCAAKTARTYPAPHARFSQPGDVSRRAACSKSTVKEVKTPIKPAWKVAHAECSRGAEGVASAEWAMPARKAPEMLRMVAETSSAPTITIGQNTDVRHSARAPHATT
mmetsp:Transcript_24284/g.70915  ORF Transcript_24284/g.70915 Transcript_24284/m.70915 type:complete len:269 (+) Transcript_24284:302-1108(+)